MLLQARKPALWKPQRRSLHPDVSLSRNGGASEIIGGLLHVPRNATSKRDTLNTYMYLYIYDIILSHCFAVEKSKNLGFTHALSLHEATRKWAVSLRLPFATILQAL